MTDKSAPFLFIKILKILKTYYRNRYNKMNNNPEPGIFLPLIYIFHFPFGCKNSHDNIIKIVCC